MAKTDGSTALCHKIDASSNQICSCSSDHKWSDQMEQL